jgi:hypothetical protein
VLIEEGTLLCHVAVIGHCSLLYFSLGDGPQWIFVALQGLIFDNIPRDVPMGIVGKDSLWIKAYFAHDWNNAVKFI